MPPFFGLARARSFGLLHALFRIDTEDEPYGHLVSVCQLHDYVGDSPRIAFRTPFEASQHLEPRTDRCLVFRQQLRQILSGAPHPVGPNTPGSSVQILTPNGATSIARESLKP